MTLFLEILFVDTRKFASVTPESDTMCHRLANKQTLLIQLSIVERFHFLSSLILIERQPVLCI